MCDAHVLIVAMWPGARLPYGNVASGWIVSCVIPFQLEDSTYRRSQVASSSRPATCSHGGGIISASAGRRWRCLQFTNVDARVEYFGLLRLLVLRHDNRQQRLLLALLLREQADRAGAVAVGLVADTAQLILLVAAHIRGLPAIGLHSFESIEATHVVGRFIRSIGDVVETAFEGAL